MAGKIEDDIPESCVSCGSSVAYHGGHGRPIRRSGWYRYKCGRRWHPDHGWDMQWGDCRARELQRLIDAISDFYGRAAVNKIARAARRKT